MNPDNNNSEASTLINCYLSPGSREHRMRLYCRLFETEACLEATMYGLTRLRVKYALMLRDDGIDPIAWHRYYVQHFEN